MYGPPQQTMWTERRERERIAVSVMANARRSSWLGGPGRPGDEAQEIDFDKLPASGNDSLAAGGIDGPRDADAAED